MLYYYAGGLVGSQRPDLAALIRHHFTTFSNFIHCHMRHILVLPSRDGDLNNTTGMGSLLGALPAHTRTNLLAACGATVGPIGKDTCSDSASSADGMPPLLVIHY